MHELGPIDVPGAELGGLIVGSACERRCADGEPSRAPERPYPEPPANPSDEELSRDWNLSAADRIEVMRSRGAAHRHRFALQLCALRALGMFVDDVSKLPVRITNHVGRQLGLPPLLFLEDHERPATAAEQAQRILPRRCPHSSPPRHHRSDDWIHRRRYTPAVSWLQRIHSPP